MSEQRNTEFFIVNMTADINYGDNIQRITKTVNWPTSGLTHGLITDAYIDFLNGCGFVVTAEDLYSGNEMGDEACD